MTDFNQFNDSFLEKLKSKAREEQFQALVSLINEDSPSARKILDKLHELGIKLPEDDVKELFYYYG